MALLIPVLAGAAIGAGIYALGGALTGQGVSLKGLAVAALVGASVGGLVAVAGGGFAASAAARPAAALTGRSLAQGVGRAAARPWKAYLSALDRHPLLVKSATSGTLFGAGDLLAQRIEGRDRIDWRRAATMVAFGLAVHGPGSHAWYAMLDRLIASRTLPAIAAKIALDQLAWTPVFTTVFFGATGLAEGRSPAEVGGRIRRDLWPTLRTNWMIWPAAHAVNFRFVPPNLRVLYVNLIALAWNSYLSRVAHDQAETPEPQPGVVSVVEELSGRAP